MELNECQTQITDELLKQYNEDIIEKFYECINSVPFIKRLISKDRKRAKDLDRDEDGKIIVDITNPHILEDMDYFRPAAIHFEKHGRYTLLKPNSNPNSEYGKWLREETRRCYDGYVRESDGEWIPGLFYFYLNYCPIVLSESVDGNEKMAVRTEGFPKMWDGAYWRFHYLDQARKSGCHAIELARRGASKSYSLAAIMARNFILGETYAARKRFMTILTAYQNEYLSPKKDGTLGKFVPIIDFLAQHMQWPRRRLVDSKQNMTWQMGYKDVATGVDMGSRNTVMGVSSKDDEGKLRGKRGYILIEEMGSFPSLHSIYNTIRYGVEEGDKTFGIIYLVGTASEDASDFSSAKTLLYAPKAYNIKEVDNVYDKFNQGKPKFGYFFPAYVSRLGCVDKNGNSDVTKALLQILVKRDEAKYSIDPNTVLRVIAEMPITPAEAIIKVGQNLFPIAQLTERLGQIDSDPRFYDNTYVGSLTLGSDGNVKFVPSSDKVIREFPHEDNKGMEGAVEIYNMPEKDSNGKIIRGRYIIGIDPYDDDSSHTTSLGSALVLDLWTDRIVAEYTGRPLFADDFYEICRLLGLYYNATINYENNKKGLFAYFSRMNCTYLLCDTLEYLRDKMLVKEAGIGNKAKGTIATLPINNYAKTLIRAWLLQSETIEEKDDKGEYHASQIPRLFTLRNRALIQELINYNAEGNFDRVSSMGMLMLLREDRLILGSGNLRKETGPDPYTQDKFFKRFDDAMSKHNRNSGVYKQQPMRLHQSNNL